LASKAAAAAWSAERELAPEGVAKGITALASTVAAARAGPAIFRSDLMPLEDLGVVGQ